MYNYGCYEREELTSYDKFMLDKREKMSEKVFCNEDKKPSAKCSEFNVKRKYDDYDNYLFNQLSRTAPSEERILTKEEFYNSGNANKKRMTKSAVKRLDNVKFKKGGKLIFILYVIIVVALASILIVANTTGIANFENANAATNTNNEKGIVSSMTINEENSENDNWFDRMCDAINK